MAHLVRFPYRSLLDSPLAGDGSERPKDKWGKLTDDDLKVVEVSLIHSLER
jgi:hypothetical protein